MFNVIISILISFIVTIIVILILLLFINDNIIYENFNTPRYRGVNYLAFYDKLLKGLYWKFINGYFWDNVRWLGDSEPQGGWDWWMTSPWNDNRWHIPWWWGGGPKQGTHWYNSWPGTSGRVLDLCNWGIVKGTRTTRGHPKPHDDRWEFYSLEWTGYFYSDVGGRWQFATASDDASYVWVGRKAMYNYSNGNATVNNGGLHGRRWAQGGETLNADTFNPIRIQFGENGGGDNFDFWYARPGHGWTCSQNEEVFYSDANQREWTLINLLMNKNPILTPNTAVIGNRITAKPLTAAEKTNLLSVLTSSINKAIKEEENNLSGDLRYQKNIQLIASLKQFNESTAANIINLNKQETAIKNDISALNARKKQLEERLQQLENDPAFREARDIARQNAELRKTNEELQATIDELNVKTRQLEVIRRKLQEAIWNERQKIESAEAGTIVSYSKKVKLTDEEYKFTDKNTKFVLRSLINSLDYELDQHTKIIKTNPNNIVFSSRNTSTNNKDNFNIIIGVNLFNLQTGLYDTTNNLSAREKFSVNTDDSTKNTLQLTNSGNFINGLKVTIKIIGDSNNNFRLFKYAFTVSNNNKNDANLNGAPGEWKLYSKNNNRNGPITYSLIDSSTTRLSKNSYQKYYTGRQNTYVKFLDNPSPPTTEYVFIFTSLVSGSNVTKLDLYDLVNKGFNIKLYGAEFSVVLESQSEGYPIEYLTSVKSIVINDDSLYLQKEKPSNLESLSNKNSKTVDQSKNAGFKNANELSKKENNNLKKDSQINRASNRRSTNN